MIWALLAGEPIPPDFVYSTARAWTDVAWGLGFAFIVAAALFILVFFFIKPWFESELAFREKCRKCPEEDKKND